METLFPHEMEALLQALRRDLRSEQIKASMNPADADIHLCNVRFAQRVLEVLNPRGAHRSQYRPMLDAA
jgi:hypothetical protein